MRKLLAYILRPSWWHVFNIDLPIVVMPLAFLLQWSRDPVLRQVSIVLRGGLLATALSAQYTRFVSNGLLIAIILFCYVDLAAGIWIKGFRTPDGFALGGLVFLSLAAIKIIYDRSEADLSSAATRHPTTSRQTDDTALQAEELHESQS